VGTNQYTDDEHPYKTGQTYPAKEGVGQKAGQDDEGEA